MLFSIFNVIWVTTYLQAWKRYSAELAFRWGTLDQRDDLLAEPRPLFTVCCLVFLIICTVEGFAHDKNPLSPEISK